MSRDLNINTPVPEQPPSLLKNLNKQHHENQAAKANPGQSNLKQIRNFEDPPEYQ